MTTVAIIFVTAGLSYWVGYHRGHVQALKVPYAMLAARMEELMGHTAETYQRQWRETL